MSTITDLGSPSLGIDSPAAARDESWRHRSLCTQTDPDAYYPEKGESAQPAKRICNRCEVKPECLQWALEKDQRFGIWGGLTSRERRQL